MLSLTLADIVVSLLNAVCYFLLALLLFRGWSLLSVVAGVCCWLLLLLFVDICCGLLCVVVVV